MPRILIALFFGLMLAGLARGPAQAQPAACILDCMAKDQFCQTPCFNTATQCRAACKTGDRKCVRACVKPCTTDYKKCAVACNKR